MDIALAIVVLLGSLGFAAWLVTRMLSLIRELGRVTTGLTRLGVEVGRVTDAPTTAEPGGRQRAIGSG